MGKAKSIPLSAYELRDAVRHEPALRPFAARPHPSARRRSRLHRGAGERLLASHRQPSAARDTTRRRPACAPHMRTIGESIARNTAGPDGRPAVTHVESLTLITPEGELRRINRIGQSSHLCPGSRRAGPLRHPLQRHPARQLAFVLSRRDGQGGNTSSPATALRTRSNFSSRRKHLSASSPTRKRAATTGVSASKASTCAVSCPRKTPSFDGRAANTTRSACSSPAFQPSAVRCAATQLRRELIDAAIAAGGSFPIARTPEATREQVAACYPELTEFLAEKRRIDPSEKLVEQLVPAPPQPPQRAGPARRAGIRRS